MENLRYSGYYSGFETQAFENITVPVYTETRMGGEGLNIYSATILKDYFGREVYLVWRSSRLSGVSGHGQFRDLPG